MKELPFDARYINAYTDFGFKKLFGETANKDLLIDFLNQVLPDDRRVVDLTFKKNDNLPDHESERKAIFDIHCVSPKGDTFIVEMQQGKLVFFKDRSVYYTSFPIREQAQRGIWSFELNPVCFIGILDFIYEDKPIQVIDSWQPKIRRDVYEKLYFCYLQMPAFNKQEHELETRLDKWLYFLKNLETFDAMPEIFAGDTVFEKAFHESELEHFTPDITSAYWQSRMAYWDNYALEESRRIDREDAVKAKAELEAVRLLKAEAEAQTAEAKAQIAEAEAQTAEAKAQTAEAKACINSLVITLFSLGLSVDVIAEKTGLSTEEVEQLVQSQQN
jgi:predicted transposase/invertase (TIGR01784 family)